MRLGIVIQTITQTGAVLTAFALGLLWHLRGGDILPAGANPLSFLLQYDWRGVDVQTAETMAFITLSLCELFRAYTVRSERALALQARRFLQPLHAVRGRAFHGPAAAGGQRAVPAAGLQHPLPERPGMGGGARPGAGAGALRRRLTKWYLAEARSQVKNYVTRDA